MNFHVMTLFPDQVSAFLGESITGRAIGNGLIKVNTYNIRDYTTEKHGRTDDYPYGGGSGMLMQAQPVYDCYRAVEKNIGRKPRVLYMSPQGKTFTQSMAEELAKEDDLVLLCGHYEGIDERALELIGCENVSIGDYVLTGGEMPAVVIIDAVSRLIPGVLHGEDSATFETFHDGLLEYPQYSRPEVFEGLRVPEILLSGNHGKVDEWRREQSIKRTLELRPELIDESKFSKKELKYYHKLLDEKSGL
ncbi:MAG: tRNA (guanosine(37)-N1)-methyltransferase TrmD [Eubacteriales bacterium]|nr:tRNA (guanosine(37)-N1)-methyltransferase TrmD [Eubacteriales bacterium]